MGGIRNFTGPEGHFPTIRNVGDGAPDAMRHELVDFFFSLAEEKKPKLITEDRLYRVICQSLGQRVSGDPYGGYRYKCGKAIADVEWPRVYDLICRLWPEFRAAPGFGEAYREGVNQILAAYAIAWDLGADGRLHRILPAAAQARIEAAIQELSSAAYAPALALFNAARDAYDNHPRRDRDACTNVFDAMESVAKIKYNRPNDTFGQVKNHIQQNNLLRPEIIGIFTALNNLRNDNFGHGMTVQFNLSPAEVDFVYLTCIAGILLLRRTP